MPDIKVTDVRVKLASWNSEKLVGYCSITLNNAVVVKDLKIIQGEDALFIAMPSRKIADKCRRCGCKNHLRARFCNDCGEKLRPNRASLDDRGKAKLHFDLVHPINSDVRDTIQRAVVEAYHAELARSGATQQV